MVLRCFGFLVPLLRKNSVYSAQTVLPPLSTSYHEIPSSPRPDIPIPMAKLITVFGATGNQGGSVVSAVLDHPEYSKKYKIRAITRDPSKPSAQALAEKGAETIRADLSDPSSLEAAVAGSYAVFAVTNYWELMSMEKELDQGKAIGQACGRAGVQHLVWSALPDTTKMTNGQLPNIDHFVSKAHVAEYLEQNKGDKWATYFMPAYFMQNFHSFVNKGPDGTPTLAAPWKPDTPLALIDIKADTGKFVIGALEAGAAADGKWIQGTSEWSTPQAVADTLTKAAGTTVKFQEVPRDVFKGFLAPKMGDFGAEELTQNMELIRDYSYFGKGTEKQQAESDKFVAKGLTLTSFADFAQQAGPWKWD